MQKLTIGEARGKLSSLMDDVLRGEQVTLTRFGRDVGVIVSDDWYKKAQAALAARPEGAEKS